MKRNMKRVLLIPAAFFMMVTVGALSPVMTKAASPKVEIDSKNFPNQSFREALKSYDTDGDGYLVISDVKNLDLADKGISSPLSPSG